jgi:hypothetical protein
MHVCDVGCVRVHCATINWHNLLRIKCRLQTNRAPFEVPSAPLFITFDNQIEKQTRKQEQGMILTIPKVIRALHHSMLSYTNSRQQAKL